MTARRWLFSGVLVLLLGMAACPTTLAALGEVPTWARDLNCDGHVDMGEWFDLGIDHGWRPAIGGPSDCMEVYSFKDAMPVVLRCETSPHCRPPSH